jgi:hypothetical protein
MLHSKTYTRWQSNGRIARDDELEQRSIQYLDGRSCESDREDKAFG